MYIRKLSLLNFKNIAQADLELAPGINCFTGRNGAGKTNVIDAVWYLAMCKSSLAMTDGQSVRHGEEFFLLNGEYLSDGGRHETVTCSFKRNGGKTLKRNGKEYERLSEHIGAVPTVIVSPADIFSSATPLTNGANGSTRSFRKTTGNTSTHSSVTTMRSPNGTGCSSSSAPPHRATCSKYSTCSWRRTAG